MDEKTTQKLIDISFEKIKRINNSDLPLSFKKNSIKKLESDIEDYKELLLDKENFKRKTVPAAAKPPPVVKIKVVKTVQKPNNSERTATEREMQREHDRYVNTNIPDHLLEKLKNMPQDRGFIYKRVYLFGHLPRKVTAYNNIVLTERVGDKIMVHEYNSKIRSLDQMYDRGEVEYKYYEKPKWEPRPPRRDNRGGAGNYDNRNNRTQENRGGPGNYDNRNNRTQENRGGPGNERNSRAQENRGRTGEFKKWSKK
jgi:hypothetical protein